MKRAEIEERTEALLVPILNEQQFELWDVEYVKEGADFYLRAYIDKEGGITIDDCVTVSRALEAKLDEENFISDGYILEVSSPGLNRPLKRERDFEKSIGRKVEIKLYKAIDGQKEFEGRLKSYDKEKILVSIEDAEEPREFMRDAIAMIRLAFEE